jgi:hypothetical protein
VKRRELMLLLAGAMTAARAVRAQQAMPVIGFLGSSAPGPTAPRLAAKLLRVGLAPGNQWTAHDLRSL